MGKHITRSRGSGPSASVHFDGEHVPKQACENRTDLSAVTFKEGVQSVGYCGLYGCKSLTTLELPKSMRIIKSYAFCNCKALESIQLNDGLEEIEDHALMGCTSLTEIEIPKSVNIVGKKAFEFCQSLREVRIIGSPEFKTGGEFGKGGAFDRCDNLERIVCMAKDSSKIDHAIPHYLTRVESEGEWALVYERDEPKVEEEPHTKNETQESPSKTAKKRVKTTKQSTAASESSTDGDAPQLSRRMFEVRKRVMKALDKELLIVDKEHKKGVKNSLKMLKETSEERDELKKEVENLRKINKDLEAKLRNQKKTGGGNEKSLPRTKDLEENVKDLQKRLDQKEQDLADLRKDKDDMRNDKADLREQQKALQKENTKLSDELQKKDVLIEGLRAQLAEQTKEHQASMGSNNPETPKRRHYEVGEESTVEKARKKKRTDELKVQETIDGIWNSLEG